LEQALAGGGTGDQTGANGANNTGACCDAVTCRSNAHQAHRPTTPGELFDPILADFFNEDRTQYVFDPETGCTILAELVRRIHSGVMRDALRTGGGVLQPRPRRSAALRLSQRNALQ
jgi:hypothetical protein